MASLPANSKPFVRGSLLLVGLMFVVPFVQSRHPYPLPMFYNEWLAFAFGLAALSLLLGKDLWRDFKLPLVALAPIALIPLLWLQAALGRVPYVEQAQVATLYLIWAALLILLGSVLRRELGLERIVAVLAWCLLVGGILNTGAALVQHYRVAVLQPLVMMYVGSRVYGNLAQWNHLADYIALALAALVYLYGSSKLRISTAACCSMLLLFVLAITATRATWLYLGVLWGLAALHHAREKSDSSKRLHVLAAALVPGFVLANWAATLPILAPPLGEMETVLHRHFDDVQGTSGRFLLWKQAWQIFLQSPWIGVGYGQFAWHHFELYAAGDIGDYTLHNHAHNLVMHVLAEMGLAGATVVIAGMVLWIAGLRHSAFKLADVWLLATLAVIGIHSMLEYPLWYGHFLGIASFTLGMGATGHLTVRLERVGRPVAIVLIVFGWYSAVSALYHYRGFERLFFTTPMHQLPVLDQKQFAGLLMQFYREPVVVPWLELNSAYVSPILDDNLPELLALNGRVMRFYPNVYTVYRQALLLALNGDKQDSLRQLRAAARVYPKALQEFTRQVREMSGKYPEKLQPLLESAVVEAADLRVPVHTDD